MASTSGDISTALPAAADTKPLTIRDSNENEVKGESSKGTEYEEQVKLAELERLSNEYQPTYSGAYVGNLQSSRALQTEYANGDPIFVRKTTALAPKYSCMRVIRGDGNCAWRALAFGYFELLLRTNDEKRVASELERLRGLNSVLNKAGYSEYLYEDFADASFELLKSLEEQTRESKGQDDTALVAAFNDQGTSDAIITHFKFLTSAWMKLNPDNYQPFLPDQTVDEYCSIHVEPYGVEAEHVGINALIDCIFLPASLAVEIIYLDRSAGDEVNVHQFGKTENEKSVLRLLYRPGHYDILYKKGDIAEPPEGFSEKPVQPKLQASLAFVQTTTNQIEAEDYESDSDDDSFEDGSQVDTPGRTSPFNSSHFLSDEFQPALYNPRS